MVVIDKQTQVIGVGDDIEKLRAVVGSPCRFHHLVALVEQRHHAIFALHAGERDEQRAVFVEGFHLKSLFKLFRNGTVDVDKRQTIGLETILLSGLPLAQQLIVGAIFQRVGAHQLPLSVAPCDGFQFITRPIPQRVDFGIEVHLARVDGGQRRVEMQQHVFIGGEIARDVGLHRHHFGRIGRLIGFVALFLFLLLFLPLLKSLLLLLHPLRIGHFRQHLQCVSMCHELAERVGAHVGQFHAQRVLIHQGRVAQPIVDGVVFGVGNGDEGVVSVKIQSLDGGQMLVAIAEIHREMVGLFAVDAEQIAIGLHLLKGRQRDVIRQEMGVAHALDVGNVERIAPHGVLSDVGFIGGLKRIVVESNLLTLLVELIVAIHILQGIDAIGARFHAFDDEMAATVGATHAQHGQRLKGRVG